MNDLFSEVLKQKELADLLRLSDAADFGRALFSHAKENLKWPFYSLLDLKDAFKNIPAILVGGGPSLEKNGHLLHAFQSKAILFAGGHALEQIGSAPHFGAILDKDSPLTHARFPNIPLCFQARMHPGNGAIFQGEKILSPDGHFSFLNFLSGDTDLFDSGWTVGNFMVAIAQHFGCNPIVCVGMDYCYQKEKKYAFGQSHSIDGLIQTKDQMGKLVWTQSDWLLSVSWMIEFANRHRETTFLNATGGGLSFFDQRHLEDFSWEEIPNLREKVESAIGSRNKKTAFHFQEWEESVKRSIIKLGTAAIEDEIFYHELLLPLWQIWKPVFAKSKDLFSIPYEEKMRIHQKLFFERVLQCHA